MKVVCKRTHKKQSIFIVDPIRIVNGTSGDLKKLTFTNGDHMWKVKIQSIDEDGDLEDIWFHYSDSQIEYYYMDEQENLKKQRKLKLKKLSKVCRTT